MAADSTGELTIVKREIIQNKGKAKNHYVKMIRSTSEERKQTPIYSRPSVICKLSKSGVGSNIISQTSSSCTALHQESKHGRVSEAFPLNSQEKDLKYEDKTGHISSYRKRTISQARFDEPHPFEDESTAYKQEDRDVHCPWYYRKRTNIIQPNAGEPHPNDNTVIKQAENKDGTACPARPYGKRSKRQAFLPKPWPSQRDDESTLFNREDRDKNAIGHRPWIHGRINFNFGEPCEILGKSVAFTRENGNQACLGKPYQKDDSVVFEQAGANTLGHIQWFNRKETIKQASIGQTPHGNKYKDDRIWYLKWLYGNRIINQVRHLGESKQIESTTFIAEKDEETTANRLPWSYGNRTVKQAHLREPQQRETERTLKKEDEETTANMLPWLYGNRKVKQAHLREPQQREAESRYILKEKDEETATHFPWLNGKRTIKHTNIGGSQQKVKSSSFVEVNSETSLRIKQLPNDQLKNPSEYNVTADSLGYDYDPLQSRKEDVSSPSKDFHPIKQDVVGWSNVAKGITGTTCPICSKKMSRAYHLKSHMLIHTGEKPYKCAYCNKIFNQIGNRNAHQRIHTGEKPFSCECCGKRFVFSSSKHNHMKIHLTVNS